MKTLTEIITELRSENKQLKEQLASVAQGQSELRNEMKCLREIDAEHESELKNIMKHYRTEK